MNRITLALLLLASLALPTVAVRAQDSDSGSAPPPASGPSEHPEKTTELGKRMKRIAKAYKQLRKQIDDPSSNASSLQLVADIKAAATEALQFKPEKEADLPPDQQADFQQHFEDAMKQFIGRVGDLAAALKANDNDKAADLVKQLYQLERKDHHQFRKPHHE